MSATDIIAPETGLPLTSLLVVLDGSAFAARAVAPAAHLAGRLGVPVHLWSAEHAGEALPASDDPRHRLVCLATHGRNRTEALVHSPSAEVIARSAGPVLLVGPAVPPEPPPGRRLAVCVDGRAGPEPLVGLGVAWAAALGLDVTVLTVAEPVPESVHQPGFYPRLHGPHGDADAYIRRLAEAWSGDVSVTGHVIWDPVDVHGALVGDFGADRPDLVVMGTRASHGLRRLVLGSTGAAVAHISPAPVLVVPEPSS